MLVNPFNPSIANPGFDPNWQERSVNTDFNAGFYLNFRHVFPNSGNDINLYWAHLRTGDSSAVPEDRGTPPDFQMAGPNWNIGPNANFTKSFRGKVNFSYDVLNAEVGKSIELNPNLSTRLFTGVSGLWLNQINQANFYGQDIELGPFSFIQQTTSKYSAAGVRLGIDGEYKGKYNINPVGLLAGNIFIGSQQPSTKGTFTGGLTTYANNLPTHNQYISHRSYIQVVPAIDAKLGLKYSKVFTNDRKFTIEGGYMAAVYINAIQNYVISTTVPLSHSFNTGSFYLQSLIKTIDSFAIDGPYVSFSYKM